PPSSLFTLYLHDALPILDTDTKIRRSGYKMDYETETVTVSLAQPLFRPGAWYAYKQGKAATSLADAQFADARQQFFHRVASAYLDRKSTRLNSSHVSISY